MYLISEFRDKAAAADAIRMLREHGVTAAEMDVFSEEPVEFRRGVLDRPSRMSLASVLGGILFGLLATAFVFWAQHKGRSTALKGAPIDIGDTLARRLYASVDTVVFTSATLCAPARDGDTPASERPPACRAPTRVASFPSRWSPSCIAGSRPCESS